MSIPKILSTLALILVIAAAQGCGTGTDDSPAPAPSSDVSLPLPSLTKPEYAPILKEWEKLAEQGGCLTGCQDWSTSGPNEGSVLRSDAWRTFLDETPPGFALALLELLPSEEDTAIHVCPHAKATKGELAVYTAQHLLRANWVDYDGGNAVIVAAAKDKRNRQAALRRVLRDEETRTELRRYFARMSLRSP